jgi:lipopolysaccharide/colanic/teichoic acid biosynthesis glycosyltransferase
MRRSSFRSSALDLIASLIIVGAVCVFSNGVAFDAYTRFDQLFRLRFGDLMFTMVYYLTWRKLSNLAGLHEDSRMSTRRLLLQVCKVSFVMSLLLGGYLATKYPLSQTAESVAIFLPCLILLEFTRSLAGDGWFYLGRRPTQNVIILGSGRRAQKAWRDLRLARDRSICFRGFVDDSDPSTLVPDIRERHICNTAALGKLFAEEQIDVMVVAAPLQSCFEMSQRAVTIAEAFSVRVLCLQDTLDLGHSTILRRGAGTFCTLVPEDESYIFRQAIKNLAERLVAIVLLALGGAVLALTALLSWTVGTGPFLITRMRRGRRWRLFRMLMFSACEDSETCRDSSDLWAARPHGMSRWGSVLRHTSIYKLPQLWNVVMGDMSIVGPLAADLNFTGGEEDYRLMRRFSVKPGITGLWRTADPAITTYRQIAELDLAYIDNWSLRLDLRILLARMSSVLQRVLMLNIDYEISSVPEGTRDSAS